MKQWIIYKHTSIQSGKSYIGLTSTSMDRRWVQHKSDAKAGSTLHFHNAIRLYGIDNWEHEIIADGINSIEEANQLEIHFINKFDTFENGYNLTTGGDGAIGAKRSKEYLAQLDAAKPKHKFIHFEHGIEELTLNAMTVKYNMSKGTLHGLINGTKDSYYGWQMYNVVGDNPIDYRHSDKLHVFSHEVYGDVECTAIELSKMYNLMYYRVKDLLTGKQRILKGWVLFKNKGKNPQEGIRAINRLFKHKDGTEYIGYSSELCRMYNLSTSNMSAVIKGKRHQHKGWSYIKDLPKDTDASD